MRLTSFSVKLYRNVVDSGSIAVENAVTCLVGKNESGKTALLQALYSLKPAYPHLVRVNLTMDYPRWRKVRDEREGDLGGVSPIEALFSLDDDDLKAIAHLIPFTLPAGTSLAAKRSYAGSLQVSLALEEPAVVSSLLRSDSVPDTTREAARETTSLQGLLHLIAEHIETTDKRTKAWSDLNAFRELIVKAAALAGGDYPQDLVSALENALPTIFYFSEYNSLAGRIDLTALLQKPPDQLTEEEQTALSLLHLVEVQGKEFMEANFEVRVAELEAAANEVSRQVFDYWTQNTDLIVSLHGDSEAVPSPQGQNVVHRFLDVRLNDLRHQMTTNFETRSAGFQWFFSFVVAFSEFEHGDRVVVLLDEPAQGLHAKAQADLLRFIDERLGPTTQVLFTTHSPFMVDPRKLQSVRLVEDLSSRAKPDIGAKVSTDVLSVKGDTLFPLQAALGYDIAQNLFVGRDNLIVEGPADYVYLSLISDHLRQLGRTSLNARFTITPVGGADKIPTFIALLGSHLDVTVLVDSKASQNKRLMDMINSGLLKESRLISVGQVAQASFANIEDLFEPDEYISLYNQAFSASLESSKLQGSDTIVSKIERAIGSKYDHLPPAIALLGNAPAALSRLSSNTIQRFESLLALLNGTLDPA